MKNGNSFDDDFAKAVERVKNDSRLNAENKKVLVEFSDKCFADGLSKGRLCKLMYVTRYLGGYLGKPFIAASKMDIQNVVAQIERNDAYSDWTKYDFKVILKKLYKWLKGNDELYPDEVRWIKPRIRGGKRILPDDLITYDDVKKMAEVADHPRDKAFVMVLYESGCRVGEMLSIHLKSVQFDEFGAVLRVTGKTGDRRVRIVSCAPLLAAWIDVHPDRSNPEAMLWAGRYDRYCDIVPTYNTITERLRTLATKAGIRRRVYPHLFRHSRATSLAGKLTEAQMKEHFGWVQSSKMASVYVHLSGRDVDNAILQTYGMAPIENKKDEKLSPKNCSRCSFVNSTIAKFCSKCGYVLSAETVYQVENERQKADEIMNKLMANPEFKKFILEKAIETGLANATI